MLRGPEYLILSHSFVCLFVRLFIYLFLNLLSTETHALLQAPNGVRDSEQKASLIGVYWKMT